MKSQKILAVITALALMLVCFASCGSNTPPAEESSTDAQPVSEQNEPASASDADKINLSLLKGPTGMGGAYLWTKSDSGETRNEYNITLDTDASTVGPKLMTGEYDIAAIPTNLASSLYNKSEGKVKVIAVNTLGVLYIVAKDSAVSSVADLAGKTILASGEGTIAEYALDYVLEANGLKIGTDVNIEFSTEHSESVTKALAGEYDIVLLPEPFVSQISAKDSSFAPAVNLTEEWEKTGDCTLTMGCLAVNTAFYEAHEDEVATFLEDYAESVEYVNNNIEDAAKLIEEHDIMAAAVAQKAIPNSNIVCITGSEMKTALESCYKVLFEQNPQIIGGSMPEADFYVETAS